MNNMDNVDKKSFCEAISDDTIIDLMNEAEEYRIAVRAKKKRRGLAVKFAVSAAAILLVALTFNITSVMALIRNLFYIPGIGITENENLSAAVLNEPVNIQTNIGDFTIEFGTKVRREDGRCEILLYFTSDYHGKKMSDEKLPATAVIDGVEYELPSTGLGYTNSDGASFSVSNNDFPDVNEFDLKFFNTTTRIYMSDMSVEETMPHLSNEINGLMLAAYKYNNNNHILGLDTISNIDTNGFYVSFWGAALKLYSDDGNKINTGGGYSGSGKPYEGGLGYQVIKFKNRENKNIAKLSQNSVCATYWWRSLDPSPFKVTIPIPEDGQTIHTDITIKLAGAVYKLTEVRREDDIIYFKDNRFGWKSEAEYDIALAKAIENHEIRVNWLSLHDQGKKIEFDANYNTIKGFDPDAESFELQVSTIQIEYFGDYTVTFD